MGKYAVYIESTEWCGFSDSLELEIPEGVDVETYASENLEVCIMLENLEDDIAMTLEANDFGMTQEEFDEAIEQGDMLITDSIQCHIVSVEPIED